MGHQNGVDQNGFTQNGLIQNGLIQNGLDQNGIGMMNFHQNSLPQNYRQNQFQQNQLSDNQFIQNQYNNLHGHIPGVDSTGEITDRFRSQTHQYSDGNPFAPIYDNNLDDMSNTNSNFNENSNGGMSTYDKIELLMERNHQIEDLDQIEMDRMPGLTTREFLIPRNSSTSSHLNKQAFENNKSSKNPTNSNQETEH